MRSGLRQRGVALITAMLIFALVGSLLVNLTWDHALDVRRTMVTLHRDAAVQAIYGAESWMQSILLDDAATSQTDHLGEIWAAEFPVLPLIGETVQGELSGGLLDLQGRFNVNNLIDGSGDVDEVSLQQFRRLLLALDLDPRFAGLVADWLDPDQDAGFPDGAEDPIYTSMTPPYRTANQPITSVSELAAIEGMDKSTLDILSAHITALPGRTPVNVNTATYAVLHSLSENLSVADVEGLISDREESGFADFLGTFTPLLEPEMLGEIEETSDYFQLNVVVRVATVRVTYFSILRRAPQGGGVAPILRSFGTT